MFKKKSNFPIGLDIADSAIKIAQIEKTRDKSSLRALSQFDLKEGVFENGEITDQEVFKQSLKSALSKTIFGSFSSTDAVVSLPESKSFIKVIRLEKGLNSPESMIGNEIEKHIPYSLQDIYYDWQIVEETGEDMGILVGAAPKKIIDNYISSLSSAGINVVAFELEAQAIARCLLKEEVEGGPENRKFAYGILNIGAEKTNFFVYSNYAIMHSFSVPVASNDMTKKISEELEITASQAEKAKLICGLDLSKAQGIINDLLKDDVSNLNSRIKDIADYYKSHYSGSPAIEKIIICGEGAYIRDIEKTIAEKQKTNAELGSAQSNLANSRKELDNIFIKTKKLELKQDAPQLSIQHDSSLEFAIAIGLALRSSLKPKI